MFLIVSEAYDKTTDLVIEWLDSLGTNFIRCLPNHLSCIEIELSSGGDSKIKINNEFVKIIWVQRGKLNFIPQEIDKSNFINYLKKEEVPVLKYCEEILVEKGIVVGSFIEEIYNNKILNLKIAEECGMKIPHSVITNEKEKIINFLNSKKKIITKSIYHPPNISLTPTKKIKGKGTVVVTAKQISSMSDDSFPSFVQEYIEKLFEIRVFIFMEKIFAMAIFSQADDKTTIDYRNYNREKPNRYVPFNLPDKEKIKIKRFMNRKKMNSGSIDLIYNNKKEYVFLEINPQGQFNWVSEYCNFYIEKEIAECLSNIN